MSQGKILQLWSYLVLTFLKPMCKTQGPFRLQRNRCKIVSKAKIFLRTSTQKLNVEIVLALSSQPYEAYRMKTFKYSLLLKKHNNHFEPSCHIFMNNEQAFKTDNFIIGQQFLA